MYGTGISKSGEIVDLGVQQGILKKSGSWFSYGETKLGQGRDAVKQMIKDNPDLMDELEEKIKKNEEFFSLDLTSTSSSKIIKSIV